jgi:anti-sigma factor RsiW
MTADILRDYMLGRLGGIERKQVRARLQVDPGLRGALRRLRHTTVRVRARLGSLGAVRHPPREWLPLIERASLSTRADERPQSWLRAGPNQRNERTLPWL